MFSEKGNALLADFALRMAKVSVNYVCIGPFYEHKKPEALKYPIRKLKV